jgi:hypothetical protein
MEVGSFKNKEPLEQSCLGGGESGLRSKTSQAQGSACFLLLLDRARDPLGVRAGIRTAGAVPANPRLGNGGDMSEILSGWFRIDDDGVVIAMGGVVA